MTVIILLQLMFSEKSEHERGRKEIIMVVFVLAGIVFLVKLFFIQVLDEKYAQLSKGNAILTEVDYPFRGLITDRHGKLIVYNTPEFDLTIILKEVKKFDTVRFCSVFGMTHEELRQKFRELKARREFSRWKPTIFLDKLRITTSPGFRITSTSLPDSIFRREQPVPIRHHPSQTPWATSVK